MARVVTIPAETDILCERCGYVLTGLPPDARCPECGEPTSESRPEKRSPPAWEGGAGAPVAALLRTSIAVLFRPTRFYRTLATRLPAAPARSFARFHWGMASLLLAYAGYAHFRWYVDLGGGPRLGLGLLPLAVLTLLTYAFLAGTTRLAATLTTWEASYRGIRLPIGVVRRGLYYHAVHYLPVALAAAVTVFGYRALLTRDLLPPASATFYLYVLCGEVVLAAVYLFKTYWIGMRNMMYANA